jgi:hypothetical protein
VKIKYIGKAGIREIKDERGRWVWASDVDYSQEVPADLAAELLTYPRPEFTVDAVEPLMQLDGIGIRIVEVGSADPGELVGLGPDSLGKLEQKLIQAKNILAALALGGVGSLEDLAALSSKGEKELVETCGLDADQVSHWVRQAKELTAGE